ncbi:MAG: hypothetical protein DMF84_17185 [Acidobacteria bacterium]|nr:MAG: hypothetical protein DMF84_17185 [Acidobacteriota bacterium]
MTSVRWAPLKPLPVADPTFTIVGIVSDITNQGPQEPPAPQVYVPYTLVGLDSRRTHRRVAPRIENRPHPR